MRTALQLGYPIEGPEQMRQGVQKYVDAWRGREGNLIMILHAIQNEFGYVPRGATMHLAQELGVSLARIYEVITFYHYFKRVPPGKHNLAVCIGTACYLKGSQNLLENLENKLGIKEGETTADREFHLETLRCIGCCGMSPAMVADGKTHGRLCTRDVDHVVDQIRARQEVAS